MVNCMPGAVRLNSMGRELHPLARLLCGLMGMLVVFAPAAPLGALERPSAFAPDAMTARILTPTFDDALVSKVHRPSERRADGSHKGGWPPVAVLAVAGVLLISVRARCLSPRAGPAPSQTLLTSHAGPRAPPRLRLS